jgi:hypothetical protein
MQKVTWSGQGEGTITSPYILNTSVGFDIQQAFNIYITSNYVDAQKKYNYFKFSNSLSIYTLAYIISNRDSLMYMETANAIKTTMILTDKTNYLDGPFIVTSYGGSLYILKQQIFDPMPSEEEGSFRGIWVSKETYSVNDTVVYNGFLYICLEANYDTIFTASKWSNLSGSKILVMERDPLPSDYNYDLGTTWVNKDNNSHFILVNQDANIATWNLGSMKPDNVSLSINNNNEMQIKNFTIEGGEW